MDRKIAFVSEKIAHSLSNISVDITFQNNRFIITGNHSELEDAATVICNLGYKINYDGSNSFEVSDLNKYFDVLIDQTQLQIVTTELRQELSGLAIDVIPQLDRTIIIVGKSIEMLSQAATIICNLGYICNHIIDSNFIRLSDYEKYSDEFVDKQTPLCDRTVEFLKNLLQGHNVILAEQMENIYAVIGSGYNLESAKAVVRSAGFTIKERPGSFFYVDVFTVKNENSEEKTA